MRPLERRQGGDLLIDLGIVFHSAGAQRIERRIDTEILLGQPGEVADEFDLGDLGESGDPRPDRDVLEELPVLRDIQLGKGKSFLCCGAQFEDQRFAAHDMTSPTRPVSRSISALPWTSVTQNRAQSLSSG